jgi:hypothetical protein
VKGNAPTPGEGLTKNVPRIHDVSVSSISLFKTTHVLRSPILIGIAAILALPTGELLAHQDPVGDVHPEVSVAEGCFVVDFSNNEKRSIDHDHFRNIYDAGGSLVVPRHRVSEKKPDTPLGWMGGLRRSDGENSYELDEEAKRLTIRSGEKILSRKSLPWPGGKPPLVIFLDFVVLGGNFIIIGTLPHPEGYEHGALLSVHRFELNSSKPPLALTLGAVATIYDFPTSSNVVVVGERVTLAWMGTPEGTEVHRFCLTTVDPLSMQTSTRRLDGDYHWNTHISIASIGTRLCVAWHDGEIYGAFRKARIRVLFEDLAAK